jgi:hypothetical protein
METEKGGQSAAFCIESLSPEYRWLIFVKTASCSFLLVALFAGSRSFSRGMAAFAGLVGKILAEPFYLAAGSGCMALGTVLKELLMGLVIEFDTSFQLNHVGGECVSSECGKSKQGNNNLFHFHSPF